MKKSNYYSLEKILLKNAIYNIIFGERSNGKTFSVQEYILKGYIEDDSQGAIIRRWDEDFRGKRGRETFSGIVNAKVVEKLTKGQWTHIAYKSHCWYLAKYDNDLDKEICDIKPFCYAFSLNAVEHDKSTSYPNIKNILFDEFLTRSVYLKDEFIIFQNVLSTIIRDREDVKIFMCGNTVNQYSPYFSEMGLTNITKMEKGDIHLYKYGDSDLTVAVEYSDGIKGGKKSDKYFAFNNQKLKMITNGGWELELYPHLPYEYKRENIVNRFYILFENQMLEGEFIKVNKVMFIYIHRKTTPIKNPEKYMIYGQTASPHLNINRKLKPINLISRQIISYFKYDKVFYQDNTIGEIVRNYFNWSANAGEVKI